MNVEKEYISGFFCCSVVADNIEFTNWEIALSLFLLSDLWYKLTRLSVVV